MQKTERMKTARCLCSGTLPWWLHPTWKVMLQDLWRQVLMV